MTLLEKAQRAQWRAWYGFLAWYSERAGARFQCMNWGYDDGRALVPAEAGEERFPLQLYAALVEGVPLAGRDVVDVSCGRGGGLSWLHRTHRPASALGLDFTPGNVALCERARGPADGTLRFAVGDAERLPLANACVDVLLSVEASHCYASLPRFLDEAARVLRPGGHLLWTDFLPRARDAAVQQEVRRRFEVGVERDVTSHVLAAMQRDAPRRLALIERHSASFLRPLMTNFAAADERCDTVQRFRNGSTLYFLRQLRRGGG